MNLGDSFERVENGIAVENDVIMEESDEDEDTGGTENVVSECCTCNF